MDRTRKDELRDSLVGRTITEVRLLDGTAVIRLERAGAADTFASFEAGSFADALSLWPHAK